MGSGKTAMILLFAMNFALYYGSNMTIASPFQYFINDYVLQSASAFWNAVIVAVLSLITLSVFVGWLTSGYGLNFSIPAQILTTTLIMNFVLTPFSIITSVDIPTPVKVFIFGIFEILILSATLSFVGGREW